MYDQKLDYTLSEKDIIRIAIHKTIHTAIKVFAIGEGLSIVAATYLILRTGLDCLVPPNRFGD